MIMEFLNNIWLALSSPNEGLVKMFSLILTFCIEMPLSIYLIQNTFKLSIQRKFKLLYVISLTIIGFISLTFMQSPFNILFNYLSAFIILFIITKMHPLKVLIASLFPSVIFSVLQNLFLNPYLSLMNITFLEIETVPIYRVLFVLLIYTTVFICSKILKYNKFTINSLDGFSKKTKFTIFITIIFGMLYIIIQFFTTVKYIDNLPFAYTFINFMSLLAYFGISFYCFIELINLTNMKQKLESVEAYNQTLHILHDNVRAFKHDFDNIVTTIGGYINTDDLSGLKTYYVQLQQDCEKVNNLYILNPDSINNPRNI